MPSTSNRGYSVPVTGTETGVWGDTLNANAALIDNNLGGTVSVSLTNSNVTLSAAQYKCGTIIFSGTLTGNVVITFPSVSGWWTVFNNTTGAFYIQLTCGGGNRVCAPPQEMIDVATDATNFYYRNLSPAIGCYVDYGGSSVPNWVSNCTVPPFLACDGTTFSAGTYPRLNTILGGNTLPDSRGRLRASLNGGQGRITTAGSGIDGDTRSAAGGAQNVAFLQANLPDITWPDTFSVSRGSLDVSGQPTSILRGGSLNTAITEGNTGTTQTNVARNQSTTNLAVNGQPSFSGSAKSGGSGTALNKMPPTYIGGITLIRAA